MKLKFLLIVFLSVLMIPCRSASQNNASSSRINDLIGLYEKSLDGIEKNCEQVKSLLERREREVERKKDIGRSDTSVNLSSTSSSSAKLRRQQATKMIAALDREIEDSKAAFLNALKANAEIAARLQQELAVLGLGDSYNFPYFSDTLIKTYQTRGLKANFDHEDMQLQKAEAPAVTLRSARFDVKTLRDSGIKLNAPNPVPDTCLHYSTFFRYYNLLMFYSSETDQFNRLRDPHAKAELTRRYKQLRPAGMALHQLLNKNAPRMAAKVNIPELLKQIDKHYKLEAFREQESLSDIFTKSTINKEMGASLEKYMSKNIKKHQMPAPAANSAKNISDSIRVAMKNSLFILNRTAADLQRASQQNDQPKMRGKRARDKENVPPQNELLPETLLFRNADAPVTLPGKTEKQEEDAADKDNADKDNAVKDNADKDSAVKAKPRKKQKQESAKMTADPEDSEPGEVKKDGKKAPARTKDAGDSGEENAPAEKKTESPAVRQTESTSVTEKNEWE